MNNCIYIRKRKNKPYCKLLNKEIEFSQCRRCEEKEYKPKKIYKIKQRTYKQAKLEKKRYSIFTNNLDKCIECPNVKNLKVDKHEIFRGRNRLNSIKWGLVIPLCRGCHNDPTIERKWRLKGYNKFVELHGKEKFIEVFKYVKGVNL